MYDCFPLTYFFAIDFAFLTFFKYILFSLSICQNCSSLIGNSSAGIREAPYYGIPTINIGTRQENRSLHSHILNTDYSSNLITQALSKNFESIPKDKKSFGKGNSAELFVESINDEKIWKLNHQKQFVEISNLIN